MYTDPGGFRFQDRAYTEKVIESSGHTNAWLAHQTGITRQFLWMLLANKRGCRRSTAIRICQALGLPGYVLFLDPDGNPAKFDIPKTRRGVPTP